MTKGRGPSEVSLFADHWQGAPPRVIFEAGARDCRDTLELHAIFPQAQIFAFECNPETLPLCRARVRDLDNIHLIDKAVYSHAGRIPFYPVQGNDPITGYKVGNSGASSLYKASGNYPVEELVQSEIEVEAVTFGDIVRAYELPGVDMLWLDMQGAELEAMKGLGDYIQGVKLIMIEVMFQAIYTDQPLYEEVNAWLEDQGFAAIAWTYRDHWFGNGVYKRA